MNIDFKVCQDCNGTLNITDTTQYIGDCNKCFSYDDTITVNIVVLEETKSQQLIAISHNTHTTQLDETLIDLVKDGLYNITHLIVPSISWYEKQLESQFNILDKFRRIILSDGKNLYEVINNAYVKLDEIEFITNIDLTNTTVNKAQKITFLTCFLWKCYIALVLEAFRELKKNNKAQGKINKCGKEDDLLIFKRDFVWATINVLNYLIEECKMEKAQEILEKVMSCNGFCFSNFPSDYNITKSSDCGCYK